MRILVVDDNQKYLAMAQRCAQAVGGIELITCSTVKEALSVIDKAEGLSLVISDMMFFEEIEAGSLISSIYNSKLDLMSTFWEKDHKPMAYCGRGAVGENGSFQEEFYRLKYGKISPSFLQCAEGYEKEWAISQGYYEADYDKIPKQFALGLVVASYALSKGIEAIIVTDAHCHGRYLQMSGIVQVPLVAERPEAFTKEILNGSCWYWESIGYAGAPPDDFNQYMQDFRKGDERWWKMVFSAALKAEKPFKTR